MEDLLDTDEVREVSIAINAAPSAPPLSLAALRSLLSTLTSTLSPVQPSLNALDQATQPILLFAIGFTACEGAQAAGKGAAQQTEQQRVNNVTLREEGALQIFSAFLHSAILAHRTQVTAMYPVPPSSPSSSSDSSFLP